MPNNPKIFDDEYSRQENSTISQVEDAAENIINLDDTDFMVEISEHPVDKPQRKIIKAQLIDD